MNLLRWVWRRTRELPGAVAYLVAGGLTGVLALLASLVLFTVGLLSLGIVGIPAIPEAIRVTRFVPRLERRRAGRRLGEPITVAYQPITGGLRQRLAAALGDPANLRDMGWTVIHGLLGIVLALWAVALPLSTFIQLFGSFAWKVLPPGAISNYGFTVDSWTTARLSALIAIPLALLTLQLPVIARWQALGAKAALGPSERALAIRVAELTATRAAALDAHGAELRRIERDLHDGAQARIAAVIMQLGLADRLRERDPDAAATLVRKAQDTAESALAELRDVVRSVYPPVLADRGLASAVSALAARCPIPCVLHIGDSGDGSGELGRRPAAMEAAAYFVIAEAITNATKHSGAEHLSIAIGGPPELLIVEVRDDGAGAAREVDGGGLAGIRRRAEALDGSMVLSSPAGGPTVVRVELPCGL